MRSIFAKVLIWSLGTFLLSLVAYWAIWHALERRGPREGDPFHHMIDMVHDEAAAAYERGGADELASQLRRISKYLSGEHLLVDSAGLDLATGIDRRDLLTFAHAPPESRRLKNGCFVHISPPRDRGYRFISIVRPWFEPPNILPYYGAIVLVIAGMGSILAMHLAAPLRNLREAVDRFGRGQLSTRVGSQRKDEIGELATAFDHMANRIETLLAAERRLLQDVSHELRSPLTRLDVAIDLALARLGDKEPMLARIKRDIGRLSVLVNELLQLTRAEGDPAVNDLQPLRLDEMVHTIVEDCDVEAEAKSCRIDLTSADPLSIRGEPELLRRAIENVVRNAIRHAPSGTAIDVALQSTGAGVAIKVRDFGPGVPDNQLEAIFEPFVRVEGHRSRETGGIGLGLAIARRAVELHRGKITANNARPGLLVTIEIPFPASGIAGDSRS
jgi:two-component system sensor histidine kinase CpxA